MSDSTGKSGGAVVNGNEHRLGLLHFHPRYWATWLFIGFLSVFWLLPRGLRDRGRRIACEVLFNKGQ